MHKLRALLIVLAVLVLASPVMAQSDEGRRILEQAVQLQQSGDTEGAIRQYEAFLKLAPDSPQARSNLGAAYARLGRYGEAIEQYKHALAIDGTNAGVRFNLGVAYYKSAKITEAIAELSKAASSAPYRKNASILLAQCHLQRGDTKRVIESLAPLQADHGDDPALVYLLGTALIRDDQIARGQQLVDRILRRGDSAEAYLILGTAQLAARDFTAALGHFKRAAELDPKLPSVHSLYGRALLATGNRDQAREAFQAELDINPHDFEAHLFLAVLLKQEEKLQDALKHLEYAQRVRPGALDVRYQIGTVQLMMGNLGDAQRVLEGVIKEAPNFVEAHVTLATVYYRLRRKSDGDRHRSIVSKLNAERQAKIVDAQQREGPADIPQPDPQLKPRKDE